MDEGEIVNVAVAQEFRGRGIGEQMLGELIRQGRLMSVKRFILDVRVGNTAAIRLYEKAGFRRLAIQKNFYENPSEDGWLMELLV